MSRPKANPTAAVMDYFRTTPLEVAQEILACCDDIVRKRKPTVAPRKKKDLTEKAEDLLGQVATQQHRRDSLGDVP